MEAPLHAAASSLLAHSTGGIDFYFALSGFDDARRTLLLRSLDLSQRDYRAVFLQEPDPRMFAGLRPFHGNLTPYYRLVLPELVPADRLLYLDSDTICSIDVYPLAELSMDHASGFVRHGVTNDYIEKAFFAGLGLPPDTPAFNSGVMLFDLAAWRDRKLTSEVLNFCRKHQEYDQTALIGTSAGHFMHLDSKYNTHLYTNTPIPDTHANPGIYHFVGSPKPWDIGGRQFHRSFPIYARALANTVFKRHFADVTSLSRWKRAYKVRGGYALRLLAGFGRKD